MGQGKLGKQAGGFLRPQGVRGSELGASSGPRDAQGMRRVSWGLPEDPGRFQGPRDAQEQGEASWEQGEEAGGFLRPQKGSMDQRMQGKRGGGKSPGETFTT